LDFGTIIKEGDSYHIFLDDPNILSKDDGYRPCVTIRPQGKPRLNGHDPNVRIHANSIVGMLTVSK
jgi:hypothetical protein